MRHSSWEHLSLTVSMPSITLPNTTCLLSSLMTKCQGHNAKVKQKATLPVRFCARDEELAAISVGAAVGHGQDTGSRVR